MKSCGWMYVTRHAIGNASPKGGTGRAKAGREQLTVFSFILIYSVLFYLCLLLSTGLELRRPRGDLFEYILRGPASGGGAGLRLDLKAQCRLSEFKSD